MTNLSDFLKVKKVRCVNGYGIVHLTEGKEYEIKSLDYISVYGDDGCSVCIDSNRFKPVLDSAENPLQGVELTPEFEAVEPVLADNGVNIQDIGTNILDTNADIKNTPKFKVGDKVYFPRLSNKLCVIDQGQEDDYVDEVNGSKALAEMQSDLDFVYDQKTKSWLWNEKDCAPQLLHATPENYEMLCKLYPHIEFEAPPKPLTGIELAKKLIAKGHNYLVVDTVIGIRVLTRLEGNTLIDSNNVRLDELDDITPLDDETGEPLTESILND